MLSRYRSKIIVAPFIVEVSYIYCLFLFLSSRSIVLFWLFIELNLCIILIILCKTNLLDSNTYKFNLGVYYFIIQSLGRILFIISACLMELFPINLSQFIIGLRLSLKAGLWPFHFWFYNFTLSASPLVFFLILTLQKFPLLFIIFIIRPLVILFLCMNIIIGLFYLFYSNSNLFYALISSSLYSVLWVYIFFCNSFLCYLYFFLGYRICVMFFCSRKDFVSFNLDHGFKFSLICAILFLLRLPPFGIFFLKLFSLIYLSCYISDILMAIIWIISFGSLIGYIRVFYSIYLTQTNFFIRSIKFITKKINKIILIRIFSSLIWMI